MTSVAGNRSSAPNMAQRRREKSAIPLNFRNPARQRLKPGSGRSVFGLNSRRFALIRIRHDCSLCDGHCGHRAVAFAPDGNRLGCSAANRQFWVGRHHLDLLARRGRGRQCAVAPRRRSAERAAVAGRGAGGGLVAAAGPAHRRAHRVHRGRPPLRRLRPGMGRQRAAADVHLPAEPGARFDPAGFGDLRRRTCSERRAAPAGLSRGP